MDITAAQLKKIVGGTAPYAVQAASAFSEYSDKFQIDTPLRAAHFWAQIGTESKLKWTTEIWGPTAAQRRYEGREDLGNVHPGDGEKFKGHSLIQVTGRANHADCRDWIRAQGINCPDFEAEPEKLAEWPWAMMGAFWYWRTRNLNKLADADDIEAVTRKVNGGTNGLADRKATLKRAKSVLGIEGAVLPSEVTVAERRWAEKNLQRYEVEAIQRRLRELGYYIVGKVDGSWGPRTEAAIKALQVQAKIAADGHWGPLTKAALADDANKYVVDEARANTTAKDLRKQGSTIAIGGHRVTWTSVLGLIVALVGAAHAAWTAPAELPMGSSLIFSMLPPPLGTILQAVAPFLMAFIPLAYTALAGQGIVKSRVLAEQTGLHNGEPDPAPSPPLRFPADGPVPGGLFGAIFGKRAA